MKRRIVLTSLIFLVIAALALYVSAQSQNGKEQDSVKAPERGSIGSGIGPYVAGRGVEAPKEGIVLIQTVIREDGTADGFRILPTPPPSTILSGKLQIEMQNGSVQVFDLKKVKKITLEP